MLSTSTLRDLARICRAWSGPHPTREEVEAFAAAERDPFAMKLSADDSRWIRTHLRLCPRCADEYFVVGLGLELDE